MSKGNMLLGMTRGAVGDVVFSRLNGQQVTRARNRQPANPRTSSQTYQRALFSNAVKFFTRGRRNLFQFAFENKKENESDYNAFMRENVKRGVVISKECFDNFDYPALGNFILSKGTLPPMCANVTTTSQMSQLSWSKDGIKTELTTVATVGDLASLMIDGVDFLNGDIITMVEITGGIPSVEGIPSVSPADIMTQTSWTIKQVMLTAGSSQPISDFGIIANLTGTTTKTLNISPSGGYSDGIIYAGVMIHSRNTASKVLVSTEELSMNNTTETAIDAARERSYTNAVVESWRTTQQAPVVSEAVMQGSIAQSIALDFNPGE